MKAISVLSPQRWLCGLVWSLLSAVLAISTARAADDAIYLREPYDTIKLDEANRNALFKVQPLDLPGRAVPPKPKPDDELEFHMLERPRKTYRVAWEHVAEVKLFERMVLDEAEQLVEAKKLDEAYPYYEFLSRRYSSMPELEPSYEKYLMASAGAAFRNQRPDEALAMLWELHSKNGQYKGVQAGLLKVLDPLLERRMKAGDFGAARRLLSEASARLKDSAADLVTKYDEQLTTKGKELLAEATKAFDEKRFAAASSACRQALAASPTLDGAQKLLEKLRENYWVVTVGVTQPAGGANSVRPDDWPQRRETPLYSQRFAASTGFAAGRATYAAPAIKIVAGKDNDYSLTLTGDKDAAFVLADQLTQAASSAGSPNRPLWSKVFVGCTVDAPGTVHLKLKHRLAALEPWLDLPATVASPSNGEPFRLSKSEERRWHWTAVSEKETPAPREIVEQTYPDENAAVAALRRGEVSVVDRLTPLAAATLGDEKSIVVQPYAGPRIDMLLINAARPRLANPMFRRAIVHAIDRPGIVRRNLARSGAGAGFVVVDRLLSEPAALKPDGDATPPEMRFNAGAAYVLAQLAADAGGAAAGTPPAAKSPLPPLILGHPPDMIAALVCQRIRLQLKAAGIEVELKDISPERMSLSASGADLLYVDWRPWRPAIELHSWLHPTVHESAELTEIEKLLERAATAASDKEAQQAAGELDDRLRAEALVLPLWKTTESLAYQKNVTGIGAAPLTLYQNVSQWRGAGQESEK